MNEGKLNNVFMAIFPGPESYSMAEIIKTFKEIKQLRIELTQMQDCMQIALGELKELREKLDE